ncbi:hypothetical protein NL676_009557 [Syzygium grande]|nr:hypothetical protein NL676_009557 [Syzygium grande]
MYYKTITWLHKALTKEDANAIEKATDLGDNTKACGSEPKSDIDVDEDCKKMSRLPKPSRCWTRHAVEKGEQVRETKGGGFEEQEEEALRVPPEILPSIRRFLISSFFFCVRARVESRVISTVDLNGLGFRFRNHPSLEPRSPPEPQVRTRPLPPPSTAQISSRKHAEPPSLPPSLTL